MEFVSHLCGESITSVQIAMYHGVSLMLTAVLLNLVLCEGQPAINGECKLFSMHAMHVTSRLSQLI